ncbi:hypothetical protein RBWH47_02945 [Rhodopirellula baltica WH47]|uniref:Uncharacterized protein n=2 Tax=Rhodopirellula baltica TaxID=265606 RepID=F2B1H8_RHOBT|nr:hypothetical protein RBWH47_02945 [Rhodopirellula baltica WH47]
MADHLQLATDFAHAANRFVDLISNPADSPDTFSLRLLESLTQLYCAALSLPDAADVDPDLDFHRSTDDEWRTVYQNVANAFGERVHYWLTYDPIYPRDGSGDVVCGSLADDCADIHRDIIGP